MSWQNNISNLYQFDLGVKAVNVRCKHCATVHSDSWTRSLRIFISENWKQNDIQSDSSKSQHTGLRLFLFVWFTH